MRGDSIRHTPWHVGYGAHRGTWDTTYAVRKLKRMSRLKRIVETTLKNDAKSCVGFDHDVTSCRPMRQFVYNESIVNHSSS